MKDNEILIDFSRKCSVIYFILCYISENKVKSPLFHMKFPKNKRDKKELKSILKSIEKNSNISKNSKKCVKRLKLIKEIHERVNKAYEFEKKR